MLWATAITLAFVAGEAVAGLLTHSLALLSDAGHNFADALALAFSAYALWIAAKPANGRKTFGYHRVAILAALVNAVSLVLIAIFILIEAARRIAQPPKVDAGPMIGVAAAALVINLAIAWFLRRGAGHDLNVKSAIIHMAGDAVAALGVVLAGIIITFTGALLADPVVSLLIGLLILASSWSILRESVNVLLEAAPEGLDLYDVETAIRQVPGVRAVHDLHVWTVGPGAIACSCHILVAEQSVREGQQVLQRVVDMLDHHFHINHTTVQIEVEGCGPNDIYCPIQSNHPHVADFHHP